MNKILACGHVPSEHGEHTTGTAQLRDGREICWDCCALLDTAHMLQDGNTRRLPLYLTKQDNGKWRVGNWPASLTFPVFGYPRTGRHNIAGTRTDVWFVGPDSYVWHGVQVGEWTEVCHARRTKEVWRNGKAVRVR